MAQPVPLSDIFGGLREIDPQPGPTHSLSNDTSFGQTTTLVKEASVADDPYLKPIGNLPGLIRAAQSTPSTNISALADAIAELRTIVRELQEATKSNHRYSSDESGGSGTSAGRIALIVVLVTVGSLGLLFIAYKWHKNQL